MIVPVILAEPHPMTRAALTALLTEDGGLEVVPAPNLSAAVRAVAKRGAPVLVVSSRLLERDPAGVRLPGPLPAGTRTIVLSLEDDPAFARDARRAGAAAYVLKDRADRDLRPAVDTLLDEPAITPTWRLSA
jgi:two-component system, NarL family, response regulator NreC